MAFLIHIQVRDQPKFWRLLILGVFLLRTSICSAETLSPERAIKGTYLYKFAPFIEWPVSSFASPLAPLNICIAGDSALVGALAPAMAGQRVAQHQLVVREFSAAEDDCHILYAPGTEAEKVRPLLEAVKNRAVLTVTDLPQESAVHGIVSFAMEKPHVRFDIDDAGAAAAHLVISSKLLSLARNVKAPPKP